MVKDKIKELNSSDKKIINGDIIPEKQTEKNRKWKRKEKKSY